MTKCRQTTLNNNNNNKKTLNYGLLTTGVKHVDEKPAPAEKKHTGQIDFSIASFSFVNSNY